MIPGVRHKGALGALNAALVLLRHLASEGIDSAEIADSLDLLEYLPRLLADDEDRTEQYRGILVDLAARRVGFQLALARFDEPNAIW